jgi:FkbM family methyltransferase
MNIKQAIKLLFKHINIGLTTNSTLTKLLDTQQHFNFLTKTINNTPSLEYLLTSNQDQINRKTLLSFADFFMEPLIANSKHSCSQLHQDLFVLSQLNFKTNGYFVEFGATNGITLSNTYLLEKRYNWSGIIAEPATCWHGELFKNRQCNIDTNCVWMESNKTLLFRETNTAELSTISSFSDCDSHALERQTQPKQYEVNTISLNDLLAKYNAPRVIDYLSIDTEGSEYEILKNFDFSNYSFKIITCEHNHTPSRDLIYNLLTFHGYTRVLKEVSQFDDWYIKH